MPLCLDRDLDIPKDLSKSIGGPLSLHLSSAAFRQFMRLGRMIIRLYTEYEYWLSFTQGTTETAFLGHYFGPPAVQLKMRRAYGHTLRNKAAVLEGCDWLVYALLFKLVEKQTCMWRTGGFTRSLGKNPTSNPGKTTNQSHFFVEIP